MTFIGSLLVAALAVGSWIAVPGGDWNPSEQVVNEIRAGLEKFVQMKATEQKKRMPEWSTYTFQFQGQEKGGQKFVFVNAYCTAPPEYSTERFVFVLDGGPCFFNVKYDPKLHTFFELGFNGDA
jgi:hypothetical protein